MRFLKSWKKLKKNFFFLFFSPQIRPNNLKNLNLCVYCESYFFCIYLFPSTFHRAMHFLLLESFLFLSFFLFVCLCLKICLSIKCTHSVWGGQMRVFLLGQRKKKWNKKSTKNVIRKKISRTVLNLVKTDFLWCIFCLL